MSRIAASPQFRLTRRHVWEMLARLGGAALAGVHVLPLWRTVGRLVSEGATAAGLGTLAVLVVFLAFFGLKAAGVRFLRVSCPRVSLVAFVVCCALAHGDDVAALAKDPARAATAVAVVVTAGTAVALRKRIAEKWSEFLIRLRDLLRAVL